MTTYILIFLNWFYLIQADVTTDCPFCPLMGLALYFNFVIDNKSVVLLIPGRMIDCFENYIRAHNLFSDGEVATIKSMAIPKRLKKKQYLLRQGNVCRFHTFVGSGCLRSYRIDDNGAEHIFSLSPVNHWVSDRVSLATETPSNEFIDALEDTEIIQLSVNSFKTLLKEIPGFEVLNTKIIADECSTSRDRIYMMLSCQAEERYRQFIRHFPQLHHRIPMYMIASYLGITRETLTRIRGNMIDPKCLDDITK